MLSSLENMARKVPLLWAATAACAGILAVDEAGGRLWWGILVGMAVVVWAIDRGLRWIMAAAIVCVGLVYGLRHHQQIDSIRQFPLAGELSVDRSLSISGRGWVASDARAMRDKPLRSVVRLDSIEVEGAGRVDLAGSDRVWCMIRHPQVAQMGYGSVFRFSGRLRAIDAAATPGGFEPAAYFFRSAHAIAELEITPGDRLEILPETRGSSVRRLAVRCRGWMMRALRHGVEQREPDLTGLTIAMVLGAKEESPDDLEEWFRRSGTMHLFAVSGLHVGVVALLLWLFAKALGIPRRYAIWGLIPAVLFYALITGLRPSSFRAAVMLSVLLFGFALRRKAQLANGIGVAALILLALDTQRLFLPGFQMSFCVVLTLGVLAPAIAIWVHRPLAIDPYIAVYRTPRWRQWLEKATTRVAGLVAVSASSWIGSMLILSLCFHELSLIGVLANLVMVPLATVIVSAAGVSILCYGLQLGFLTAGINILNQYLTALLVASATWFASLPGAHVHTGTEYRVSGESLQITVLGKAGDMAHLFSYRDRHWLLDTGSEHIYRSQLNPVLRLQGINNVDGILLSHGDSGHIGSAPEIIRHLQPQVLVQSQQPYRGKAYAETLAELERQEGKVEILQVQAGDVIRHDLEYYWEILYPSPELSPPSGKADDRCLVVRVVYHGHRILFTSDLGWLAGQTLQDARIDLKADIWVKGNHFETGGEMIELLDAVKPHTVISGQADFPPHERLPQRWVSAIEQRGVELISVDRAGSVEIQVGPVGKPRITTYRLLAQ